MEEILHPLSLLSSSNSSSSSISSSSKEPPKIPLLKLDVKFDFPMFNGEENNEKLKIWIKLIKVYLCVQRIEEKEVKIQLASLQLEGTTLIWLERKLHKGSKQMGNLLASWFDFVSTSHNQFYPLGYVQKEMMHWQSFRQSKGQSVQSFTKEFRKKALELNIVLDTPGTLLKYIGSLHHYIQCTLLLLHPTSLDEACVQAIRLERRGKFVQEKDQSKHSEDHSKGKRKDKKTINTKKKEKRMLHCNH